MTSLPSTELEKRIADLCGTTRVAAHLLSRASSEKINQALGFIAEELESHRVAIFAANLKDMEAGKEKGLSAALLDRLQITEKTLAGIVSGVRQVQALPNPLGEKIREWVQPNGLRFRKVRVPIGVIGIIYESRPNVTIDSAVLCLKTGNGVILRGGSEAIHSNLALTEALQAGLLRAGLSGHAAQLVPFTDRAAIPILCHQDKTIDLMIPRGGEGLIETVVREARMPVIKHFNGICHIYVHAEADFDMAEKIIVNAKCQRPGVCNAVETVLIDWQIAAKFVPRLVVTLRAKGVELRGDSHTVALGGAEVVLAQESDWATEYLDLILAVKVVTGFNEAVAHIERYGSRHSDAIVTRDHAAAQLFLQDVDSATVYWNASTRFTDGNQFGFGAEIGISTDKIHARGPMALEELTSYKYAIEGDGQIRD